MPRPRLAYFQFWPKEYLTDAEFRQLTPEDRGCWWDLIAYAALSPLRGALLLDSGSKMSYDYIVQRIIHPLLSGDYAERVFQNILNSNAIRLGLDGTYYNRRLLFWQMASEEKDCREKPAFEKWIAPRRAITGEEGLPEEFKKTFKTRPAKKAVEPHQNGDGPPAWSPEAEKLTHTLIAGIQRINPKAAIPKNPAAWFREMERAIRIEGAGNPREVEKVLLFAAHDNFEQGVVLSPAAMRRGWNRLTAKMRPQPEFLEKPKPKTQRQLFEEQKESLLKTGPQEL